MTFLKPVWQYPSLRLAIFYPGLIAALILAQAAISHAASDASRDAMEHFFHVSFKNLQEEAAQAKEENKSGILIMFSDPDCPWCTKMKSAILSQPAIQQFFRRHFRLLHIDTRGDSMMTNFDGKEMPEKDFAFKVHRVRATPVFIIFDANGKNIMRYTGTARTELDFRLIGEFVVSGAYKNTNFTAYKRQRLAIK